jgi:hypothetical protein
MAGMLRLIPESRLGPMRAESARLAANGKGVKTRQHHHLPYYDAIV